SSRRWPKAHGSRPKSSGGATDMAEPTRSPAALRSEDVGWRVLPTRGASVKVLRHDKDTGGSTALVRFEAGTRFPAHNHPAGEEIFVVEGDLQVGREHLKAGDYLYTPPDVKHAASSEGGCVFLVTLPKPVEFSSAEAPMQRFIIGRVVQSIVSMFVVSVVVFALVRLSGDPIQIMMPAEAS